MEIILLIIIIGGVLYFFKRKGKVNDIESYIPFYEQKLARYKARLSLMNGSESALFFEMQKQLPPNYHIFPNMRLADIVDPINYSGRYEYKNRSNKIMPKHIDFIICDLSFKPVVAVELNGYSHNRLDRIEKDEEKKKILEEAKIPLVIIKVGDNFVESVSRVKLFL